MAQASRHCPMLSVENTREPRSHSLGSTYSHRACKSRIQTLENCFVGMHPTARSSAPSSKHLQLARFISTPVCTPYDTRSPPTYSRKGSTFGRFNCYLGIGALKRQ